MQSRLKRLEEGGLVAGYRPELDLARIGIATQAFIGLEVQQGRLGPIVEALIGIPQVLRSTRPQGAKIFWSASLPRHRPDSNS